MQNFFRNVRVSLLLMLVAVMTSSCFFGSTLEVFVADLGDGTSIAIISTTATTTFCDNEDEANFFSCTYFFTDREGDSRISDFTLSNLELALYLIILDPLILQVPAAASDFQGSYSHPSSNSGGALVITTGQSSVRADATQTMQAEPGMQLIVIDLPQDAPTSGNFNFNINFKVPNDLPALDVKALFTGKVEVPGETFYLPLLPCTSDISALPAISLPFPAGGEFNLPIDAAQGCDNVTYTLQQREFDTVMLLPMLAK